jgi:ribosome maturation factor RimP
MSPRKTPQGTKKKKNSGGGTVDPALMRDRAVAAEVRNLSEPVCAAEGVELVHVEYQREAGGRILRLYIDRPGGVTLDDCARISRQLGDLLDVQLETEGPYRLEVSSPGVDRPLGLPADFDRFKGCEAAIRTVLPRDGRRQFKGVLEGLDGGDVVLRAQEGAVRIPLEEILRARLVNYNGENGC